MFYDGVAIADERLDVRISFNVQPERCQAAASSSWLWTPVFAYQDCMQLFWLVSKFVIFLGSQLFE